MKRSTLLLALLLCACAPTFPVERAATPYPLTDIPRVGDVFHPATGALVSREAMLRIATDNRIAYVGETHDNPASHRLQLEVLEAMARRYPGAVALGMEMFTPQQQPVLDRWSAGELDEKSFLREVEWFKVWKGDFDLYRDLLLFARDNSIPVIGLNTDRQKRMTVLLKPIAELTDEERAGIPDLDLSDPYHTAMVEAIYGDHVQSKGRLEGFKRVQALWDETMATSIVDYLQSPQGEDMRMVVVAGGNHIRHGFGIPRRVFRRLPTSYILIGGKEIEIPDSRQDRLMDVRMPKFPMRPYDFVAFTRYEEVAEKVKLGVGFEEIEERTGLLVLSVAPGSAAASAGLQADDILLQFDGIDLAESFDLVYTVHQKQAGDRVRIVYERNGETFEAEAELAPLKLHGR